jgi:hypothetical protein
MLRVEVLEYEEDGDTEYEKLGDALKENELVRKSENENELDCVKDDVREKDRENDVVDDTVDENV